jgi:hypothetical protein
MRHDPRHALSGLALVAVQMQFWRTHDGLLGALGWLSIDSHWLIYHLGEVFPLKYGKASINLRTLMWSVLRLFVLAYHVQ